MSIPTVYNRSSLPTVSNPFFDSFLNDSLGSNSSRNSLNYDVYSDKKNFYVDVELSGIAKENIKIDVEGDEIKISAEYAKLDDSFSVFKKNRPEGKVSQSFKISRDLDIEKIEAKFENGLLKLSIPVKEAALGRSIEIS